MTMAVRIEHIGAHPYKLRIKHQTRDKDAEGKFGPWVDAQMRPECLHNATQINTQTLHDCHRVILEEEFHSEPSNTST
jgi:hypothetical protein